MLASWNATYGEENWKLVWKIQDAGGIVLHEFKDACKNFYEQSYIKFFEKNPEELDLVCQFGECIDNAATNVVSGLDYMAQEAKSTHIQDIAVRASLAHFGRKFEGSKDNLLVIRSTSDSGGHLSPGLVPFYNSSLIERPSKCPKWASEGSIEDFWQSNKWLSIRE